MAEIKQPIGLYESRTNTKYVMDLGGVELLMCMLNGVKPDGTIISEGVYKDIFLNSTLNSDVIQAIYSIRRYPFDILKLSSDPGDPNLYYGFVNGSDGTGERINPYNPNASMMKAISIANKTSTAKGTLDDIECGAYGAVMSRVNTKLTLCENYEIQTKYNNFLDFAPYTTVEVYLPFFGTVTLNTNDVMGKQISIYYVIDYNEGTATSYILCNDTGTIVDVRTFNIAVDLPISNSNMADIKRSDFMAGATIGQSILGSNKTGTGAEKVMGVGSTIINGVVAATGQIAGNIPRITKGNSASGTAANYGPQQVYITITRPDPVVSSQYNTIHGKPVGKEEPLTTYLTSNSFLQCGRVRLINLPTATLSEMEEIERLLQEGVIG